MLTLRTATEADEPVLAELMTLAIDRLQGDFISPAQVGASHEIMGLDSGLLRDSTYFVVETSERTVGCGGWSRRATLFGGDHTEGRDPALLDPTRDAARVRAMYTHPDHVRQGVGRMILQACEAAAAAAGFTRVELAATLAGEPLYRACGYSVIERFESETRSAVRIPLLRMGKSLTA